MGAGSGYLNRGAASRDRIPGTISFLATSLNLYINLN
jgi:hypothetical protein